MVLLLLFLWGGLFLAFIHKRSNGSCLSIFFIYVLIYLSVFIILFFVFYIHLLLFFVFWGLRNIYNTFSAYFLQHAYYILQLDQVKKISK